MLSLILIISIAGFIILGRIVLRLFNFKNRNTLLLPVGFVAYQIATFLSLAPFILFNVDVKVYYWSIIVKNILLLSVIVMFYKYWIPKRNQYANKSVLKGLVGIFSLVAVTATYIAFANYIPGFSTFDNNSLIYNETIKLSEATGQMQFKPLPNSEAYTIFQTYYYDLAMLSKFSNVSVEELVGTLVPTWTIAVMFLAIKHSVREIGTYKSIMLSIIFTIIIAFFIRDIKPDDGMFIGTAIMLIAISIIYNDSLDRETSSRNLILALLSASTIFFMSANAILILLLFMAIISFYTIKRKGELLPLFTTALIIFAIEVSLVFYNIVWWGGIISALISTLLIVPCWSLQYGFRRDDRISVMNTINESGRWILVMVSVVVLSAGVLFAFINGSEFIDVSKKLYLNLTTITNTAWNTSFSILFNVLFVYIPVVIFSLIIWLYDDILKNTFIYMLLWIMVIIFNPFSIVLSENLFATTINLTSILIVISFTLALNLKDFISKSVFREKV